jgi:hypothetical protein
MCVGLNNQNGLHITFDSTKIRKKGPTYWEEEELTK